MQIRRAVITAAGRTQRTLPLQTFVDRDGKEKTALQIIVEEVLSAGIEEICLVIAPSDQSAYSAAAGEYVNRFHFVEQSAPLGYGQALSLARQFTAREAFLHLVSDHLYISSLPARCAQQVVEQARAEHCAVSAVQSTREHMLPYYGTVGGRRVPLRTDLYEIDSVLEKPTPSEAEQSLLVPGLRAGHYLCLFGIHVLTPSIMDLLYQRVTEAGGHSPVQLSAVLAAIVGRERYLAYEVHGSRHNIGVKYGGLSAQLALALAGADREEVLAQLVELLVQRSQGDVRS